MNKESLEKLKKIFLMALKEQIKEDEEENYMQNQKQLRDVIICVVLTFAPILVFVLTPSMADKYFGVFSGSVMYVSSDHFFSFSPSFILDLPYFLPLIIWTIALWFGIKTRKNLINTGPALRYTLLILIVLNSIFLLYSLWFLYSYFVR